MDETIVRELGLEIDTISHSLTTLDYNLKCDYEDYILKKSSLFESKSISKNSQDLINTFTLSEQGANAQTQKCICNLNNDLKSLCDKLETTVENYSFVLKMIKFDETLQRAEEHLNVDCYKAAGFLVSAKSLLDECSKSARSLDFYKQKTQLYFKLFADLSLKSFEKWNDLVNLKLTEHDNKTKSVSLTVSSDSEMLKSVYQTLELLRVPYKEKFCETLLNEFIKPVLLYNCKFNVNNFKLTIDYSLKIAKVSFTDVVNGLVNIFEFINSSLDLNGETLSFINSVGSVTSENFTELFITEHLLKKVPLKRIQLKEYKEAIEEMDKLLVVLTAKGFMADNNKLIKEYCCDADTVFEAKVGSRYKETGVLLMKQDLHDVVTIDAISLDNSMPELRPTIFSSEDSEKDFWNGFLTLFNNESRRRSFLKCQISKSIKELVTLIEDCLEEASQINSNLKVTLHNTAHEIVYEYLKSPENHRKLLDIIPQQSSLVFTNTLYLIMKLVHFDKQFSTEILFGELIGQLQNMGFRELNKQVRIQEDIMILSLQKSGLQDLSELEVFPKSAEKAVRQCLRQVMLLQSVWMFVLPQDVYCIVVSRLINRFIDEIINFILLASDIREDIANNLVELFTLVTEKAPQVFPESREVHRYVKNWLKLRELGLVLAGSLADINERWAGGSGPLAHELEASQVRSLIIALFQSSEIRQRTLNSIR